MSSRPRTAWAALLAICCGCFSTPLSQFEQAMIIVRQIDPPTPQQIVEAEGLLTQASKAALGRLKERGLSAAAHDRVAYVVPLSDLGRARLYARLNDLAKLEQASWAAIAAAEEYLGAHIERVREESKNAPPPASLGSSVFFRREKIRRHVFGLLSEAYRVAEERDLRLLALAQLRFSNQYLLSGAAHNEEGFIREIENSEWWQKLESQKSDINFVFTLLIVKVGQAVEVAQLQQQRQTVQAQLQQERLKVEEQRDLHKIANLEQQLADINERERALRVQQQKQIDKLHADYQRQLRLIASTYDKRVMEGLTGSFELKQLSPEIQRLPGYQDLLARKERLDDYVRRSGFDADAAAALIQLRTSLDKLTQAAQEKRAEQG